MERDRGRQTPGNIATSAGRMTNPNDEFRTLRIVEEKGVEQFLPGLPNDFVLIQIVPKLPWRAFHILSCVSPCWRKAIQSREVYKSRVRAKSMDTLLVLDHDEPDDKYVHAISLYSVKDDSWHRLPKFPFSKYGIPLNCQCVALDGKLYVLGAEPLVVTSDDEDDFEDFDEDEEVSCEFEDGSELYVLDVVGQGGWRQCARMPEPRFDFACGVLDGKLYVFGGFVDLNYSEKCLVYDPKEDEWSSIAPMTAQRVSHQAVLVGDEFWVHGGEFGPGRKALFPEVYHPGKDRWQYIELDRCHRSEIFFNMKGKLYLMTPVDIYVREPNIKPWKRLHSISFPDLPGEDANAVAIVAATAIDGEVLAVIRYSCLTNSKGALIRSEGFGSKKGEIEFKLVAGEIYINYLWDPHRMRPIQL